MTAPVRLLTICAAAALLATVMPAQERSAPSYEIVLLAGQSNMAGRGVVEEDDRRPHPRVLMLDKAGAWRPAVDPMHFDKPVAGVGPGRTFGAVMAEGDPALVVGLVPAAVGGSPIDVWQPGAFYPPTNSRPWDDAMARVAVARVHGTLRAVLWHQGESDATPELAPRYEAALHDLVARMRAAFDAPDLPFIVGQMGTFADVPWTDAQHLVDQAHRRLPAHIPGTAYVSAEGLTHGGDRIHFDAASARALGRRYAEAYLALTGRR